MFVAHPEYIRQKARQMRVEKDLTIDEISERLGISRQTIFYWVKDVPLKRPRASAGQRLGNEAMQRKYAALRDAAYEEGGAMYEELCGDPTFRDFVCMYIGLTPRRLSYSVQYHADQDLDELRRFWSAQLDIRPEQVRMQRKSNSNQLAGRTWRSVHGVLTVRVCDTIFRAKLEGWMDRLRESWL